MKTLSLQDVERIQHLQTLDDMFIMWIHEINRFSPEVIPIDMGLFMRFGIKEELLSQYIEHLSSLIANEGSWLHKYTLSYNRIDFSTLDQYTLNRYHDTISDNLDTLIMISLTWVHELDLRYSSSRVRHGIDNMLLLIELMGNSGVDVIYALEDDNLQVVTVDDERNIYVTGIMSTWLTEIVSKLDYSDIPIFSDDMQYLRYGLNKQRNTSKRALHNTPNKNMVLSRSSSDILYNNIWNIMSTLEDDLRDLIN